MINLANAYSGLAAPDLEAIKKFYTEVLGLTVSENPMGMQIAAGDRNIFVYSKEDAQPANFTVLYFPTDNIDTAVDDLVAKGVQIEKYEGLTDDKGIARGMDVDRGPNIAWFKDPAGNLLAVLEG